MLVGGVALFTIQGDGGSGSGSGNKVVSATPGDTSGQATTATGPATSSAPTATTAVKPATTVKGAPATKSPVVTVPAKATPAEIAQVISGITATIQQSASAPGAAPVTKEQVEAQLRAQLKQLGINY